MALSKDIRKKVMKAIKGGMSRRQAAARFDIGPATAVRWAKRVETTGDVGAHENGRRPPFAAHRGARAFILEELKAKPDVTIMELRDKIRERHGLGFGYGTVWRFLARHKITRKKKTGHAWEQEREDVEASREAWFEGQLDLDPLKLVFIDETAISTNMARRFGWAPEGERCRASIPFGHWKTKTLIAALRWERIDAPMTIDGALDGAAFLAYVEQVLTPTLSAGETVVMDNVRTHKVAGVAEAIEAKGAKVLYLRPIRRTSIRSRSPSRRSNRSCGASRRGPLTRWRRRSAKRYGASCTETSRITKPMRHAPNSPTQRSISCVKKFPEVGRILRNSITDNFRVMSPKDFRVVA